MATRSEGPLARDRRPATVKEAKAIAHPLRQRIIRLCGQAELTNKQLADRLGIDPGTAFYHVKQLVDAGFLVPGTVRTGTSGALEKPYRSTGHSWWIDNPLRDEPHGGVPVGLDAFQQELQEAGLESVAFMDRFMLHLSPDDVTTLERRILAIIDEYMDSDHERAGQPAYGGLLLMHALAPVGPETTEGRSPEGETGP